MGVRLIIEEDSIDEIFDQVDGYAWGLIRAQNGVRLPHDPPKGFQLVDELETTPFKDADGTEAEFSRGECVQVISTGESGWVVSHTKYLEGQDAYGVRFEDGGHFYTEVYGADDLIPAAIH